MLRGAECMPTRLLGRAFRAKKVVFPRLACPVRIRSLSDVLCRPASSVQVLILKTWITSTNVVVLSSALRHQTALI